MPETYYCPNCGFQLRLRRVAIKSKVAVFEYHCPKPGCNFILEIIMQPEDAIKKLRKKVSK